MKCAAVMHDGSPLPDFRGRVHGVNTVVGGRVVLKRTDGVLDGAISRMHLDAMLVRDAAGRVHTAASYGAVLAQLVRLHAKATTGSTGSA